MATVNPKWQAGVKERYDAFAIAYVLNACNGALAARKAGYSKNRDRQTGTRLVTIGYIKERITELRVELAEKVDISVESVVKMVIDTSRRAKLASNHTAELKAEDMLLKHLGGYEEDNAQKGDKTINIINFANIDDTKQIISGQAGQSRIAGSPSV